MVRKLVISGLSALQILPTVRVLASWVNMASLKCVQVQFERGTLMPSIISRDREVFSDTSANVNRLW